jgi:DNA-binding MarR family transcriptional regulator
MLERIHAAGHPEVTTAMIALFRFAGVDGRRPSEVAEAARLSRQATNDMLRELERLAYVKLYPDATDGRARIIKLTKRGKTLDAAVWTAGGEVERSWRARFSGEDWTTFSAVLDRLIGTAEQTGLG